MADGAPEESLASKRAKLEAPLQEGILSIPGMAQLLAQAQAAGAYPQLAPGQPQGGEAGQPGEVDQQALHQQLQQLQYAAAQQTGLMEQVMPQQAALGGEAVSYATYRNKARRKATEKPVGTAQIRQSFAKRKRGLTQKAYQLHKIADAKVFMFCISEKGESWAYATPGFGEALVPDHLRSMRVMGTGTMDAAQAVTEVMPHPPGAEADPDNRSMFATAMSQAENGGAPGPMAMAPWPKRDVALQVTGQPEVDPPADEIGYAPLLPASVLPQPGARLNFIADAVIADAAFSQAMLASAAAAAAAAAAADAPGTQGAPGEAHAAAAPVTMGLLAGDVAASTALGTPVAAPADGAPAIGVPTLIQPPGEGPGGIS
ncbi:hypothetical protein WJX81_008159 [Elliptochloris bilobata]|uniref:MADS-box domain-containing protein n=1 Tax=Elliptochloris bilobata TaxID=381761 RepID=A0AAW1S7U4_9CHLO